MGGAVETCMDQKCVKPVQWMQASTKYCKGQKEAVWDMTKRDVRTVR